MKKPDKLRVKGGFTLIEVVVATALLAVVCTGFLTMTAANGSLLTREHRLDRSNYDLSARAGDGQGEITGEVLTVEFTVDRENEGRYQADQVEEIFEQYEISETWEDMDNRMVFYRHR